MSKQKFKLKIFTSFMLFVAFLVCVVSGFVLFISPPGRVANWTSWEVMGFGKHEWSALHTVFVTIFLVAGIFHLFYFNWKIFWSYIKQKTVGGLHYKWEFLVALAFAAIFLIGTTAKVPPIISIVDLSEHISNSWEQKEDRPPVAHAETLTVKEFAKTINQPLDKVISQLKEKGYTPTDSDQTIESLADSYDISPNKINIVVKEEFGENPSSGSGKGSGSGYGKMDFKRLTRALGLTLEEAKQRLKKAGITKVKDNQTLREIGTANDTSGREVLKILTQDQPDSS